jgi:hypothetical protein
MPGPDTVAGLVRGPSDWRSVAIPAQVRPSEPNFGWAAWPSPVQIAAEAEDGRV